jgi:imidazoleglycerol phosphate dehydratase HisB
MTAAHSKPDHGHLPFALSAIERLTDAVQRETLDLSGRGPVDYRAHCQRKSQGLLELSRLEPIIASYRAHPRLRAALNDFIVKLDANHKLLHAKLNAARTVAEVVSRAISEGQSDGTYSEQIWREDRR